MYPNIPYEGLSWTGSQNLKSWVTLGSQVSQRHLDSQEP